MRSGSNLFRIYLGLFYVKIVAIGNVYCKCHSLVSLPITNDVLRLREFMGIMATACSAPLPWVLCEVTRGY